MRAYTIFLRWWVDGGALEYRSTLYYHGTAHNDVHTYVRHVLTLAWDAAVAGCKIAAECGCRNAAVAGLLF